MGGRHRSVQTLTAVSACFASGEEWKECLNNINEQHDLQCCYIKVYTLAPLRYNQYRKWIVFVCPGGGRCRHCVWGLE